MLPVLKHGQLVLVSSVITPKIGDIVMFHHAGIEKVKRISQLDNTRMFVLGDNPIASTDSRAFGWLNQTTLNGKLIWPRAQL